MLCLCCCCMYAVCCCCVLCSVAVCCCWAGIFFFSPHHLISPLLLFLLGSPLSYFLLGSSVFYLFYGLNPTWPSPVRLGLSLSQVGSRVRFFKPWFWEPTVSCSLSTASRRALEKLTVNVLWQAFPKSRKLSFYTTVTLRVAVGSRP